MKNKNKLIIGLAVVVLGLATVTTSLKGVANANTAIEEEVETLSKVNLDRINNMPEVIATSNDIKIHMGDIFYRSAANDARGFLPENIKLINKLEKNNKEEYTRYQETITNYAIDNIINYTITDYVIDAYSNDGKPMVDENNNYGLAKIKGKDRAKFMDKILNEVNTTDTSVSEYIDANKDKLDRYTVELDVFLAGNSITDKEAGPMVISYLKGYPGNNLVMNQKSFTNFLANKIAENANEMKPGESKVIYPLEDDFFSVSIKVKNIENDTNKYRDDIVENMKNEHFNETVSKLIEEYNIVFNK